MLQSEIKGKLPKPVVELIQMRFSCREYTGQPLAPEAIKALQAACAGLTGGPLGTPARFKLLSMTEDERGALRGLGTYGAMKNPTGFLAGALPRASTGTGDLEDFGYLFEWLILYAAGLGINSCWLGGAFTRSSFAQRISASRMERLPAIAALGYGSERELARQSPDPASFKENNRLAWEQIFYARRFGSPLARASAGVYAPALDMVRLGPSARNKQPWRIIWDGDAWHFYLQRQKDRTIRLASALMLIEDLQRIDMGIAMCHFELTARELGLAGRWVVCNPGIEHADGQVEYTTSWIGED